MIPVPRIHVLKIWCASATHPRHAASGPETFPEGPPVPKPEVSKDLQPSASPAPTPGASPCRGRWRGATLRAHTHKRARGCEGERGGGCGFCFSGLPSSSLLRVGLLLPPFRSRVGGRKEENAKCRRIRSTRKLCWVAGAKGFQ